MFGEIAFSISLSDKRSMRSKIKTYFKSLTKKQLVFRLSLLIIPLLMFTALMIYIFAIPGDKGLIAWVDWVRTYVIYVGIFGVLLYVLVGVDFLIASVKKSEIKRIPSIFLLVFLTMGLLISLGGFGYLGTIKLRRSGDKGPQLLVLDGIGINSVPNMAVTFFTEDKTTNTLYWGETISLDSAEKVETKASKTHGFLLDTLEPNTTYYYRINEGPTVYNFTTMVDTPNYARFAISSDTHFGASNANRSATKGILENVLSHKYDILFHLGDMVEYGFMDSMYGEAMEYMSPYVTSIPYRPAIGNHDTMFGGKTLWRGYFGTPDWTTKTDYFHIEANGIHVFVLDLEWGTESYTRAQKKWFEAELAGTSQDDWILIMNHAMYYSSGYFVDGKPWWDNQEMIDTFEPLFIQYDVDLVFSGHNHHMEYLNNSGIVYNIIGGFGGHLDPDYTTKDVNQKGTGSIWYLAGQHGYLDVEINGTTANVTFRSPEYAALQSYIALE